MVPLVTQMSSHLLRKAMVILTDGKLLQDLARPQVDCRR
jgi:hypothetical protein